MLFLIVVVVVAVVVVFMTRDATLRGDAGSPFSGDTSGLFSSIAGFPFLTSPPPGRGEGAGATCEPAF